jgi:large subunit ribosomal protein L23
MKTTDVIIKPIVTEKSNGLQTKQNRYAFKVDRRANKLEIKKAVEAFYNVSVAEVNTAVLPGKNKSRFTKSGYITGQKPAYKKAYITLNEGETLDLYSY